MQRFKSKYMANFFLKNMNYNYGVFYHKSFLEIYIYFGFFLLYKVKGAEE